MATFQNAAGEQLNISDQQLPLQGGVQGLANSGYTPVTPITPSSLQPAQLIQVPPSPKTDTSGANAMVAGADATLTDLQKQLTPPPTEAQNQNQGFLNDIASLTGQLSQKGADQLSAEQSAGIGGLKQNYATLNSQILTKNAEYQALQKQAQTEEAKIMQEASGRGITLGLATGQQGAVAQLASAKLNEKASEIGLLQAQAQGLQGQIGMAQDTVNRAIDLKFSTIEAQLKVREAQLNALMPSLNREEKITALAQQTLIEKQKQAIADKKELEKENKKGILAVLSDITKNGAPSSLTTQVANAKTPEEALRLGGAFIGKLDRDKAILDMQDTRVKMALTQAQTNKANAEAKVKGLETSTGLTPERNTEILSNIQLVNDILHSPYLSSTVGLGGFINPLTLIPGTGEQKVKNNLKQITSLLSLDSRQKLKGSGAISDFESRMLASSASSLGRNLSESDTRKELAKIKGVFQNAAGLQASVFIVDPKTGQRKKGIASRADIDGALSAGYLVEYTE